MGLSAQINKGAFMLEGGINLTDRWTSQSSNFIEGFGISFGTRDNIGKSPSGKDIVYSGKRFGYSISPRLGYFLFRNFVIGTDFKYIHNTSKSDYYHPDDKIVDQATLYGFFARKYFGNKKLTPFVEGGFGFWSTKNSYYDVSPGGASYVSNEPKDFSYYAGGLGCSYSVNTKFRINLFEKLQHTKEAAIANSNITKVLNFDSAMVLSFSYFLNRKVKE